MSKDLVCSVVVGFLFITEIAYTLFSLFVVSLHITSSDSSSIAVDRFDSSLCHIIHDLHEDFSMFLAVSQTRLSRHFFQGFEIQTERRTVSRNRLI